jgi:hypothetical protein
VLRRGACFGGGRASAGCPSPESPGVLAQAVIEFSTPRRSSKQATLAAMATMPAVSHQGKQPKRLRMRPPQPIGIARDSRWSQLRYFAGDGNGGVHALWTRRSAVRAGRFGSAVEWRHLQEFKCLANNINMRSKGLFWKTKWKNCVLSFPITKLGTNKCNPNYFDFFKSLIFR